MEYRAKFVLVLMALQSITTLRPHTAAADDTLSPLFGHALGSINSACQNEPMAQAASPSPTPHPNELISLLDPCLYSFCGDGTCVKTSTFGHRCDCNEGFSNLLNKSSLPCYRDCSIDNSCNKDAVGPSPSPSPYPSGFSLWDHGTCVKTSTFGHRCDCNEGSKNLLNDNSFACYKDCSIGADCANLGITLPHPHLPDIFKSSGGVVPNTLLWMVVSVIAVAMAHAR
ncbi:EGF [Musa troglodytarum]|uniref:EGF n=1 Tax=Musa troglodytarum TaxID=320322 RepID=A0A9E7JWM0_9LILI|nr:EGF [Musa troglodytarum]